MTGPTLSKTAGGVPAAMGAQRRLPGAVELTRLKEKLQIAALRLAARMLRLLGWEPVLSGLQTRIGHFCTEPDCYLKARLAAEKRVRALLIADPKTVANPFLLECWSRRFTVLRSSALYRFIKRRREALPEYTIVDLKYDPYHAALEAYDGPPLLALSEEDRERGRAILRRMGLPENAWFVCVHCREAGFLPNLPYHAYRDADIGHCVPAMRAIVERGGFVFRMGDPSMRPLAPQEGVIDYAHHALRSPFMDIFLSSQCRFFLGSSSGLFCVAGVFGVPVGCVNMAPLESLPFFKGNLCIPKLLYSTREKRLLHFPEILGSSLGSTYHVEQFQQQGMEVLENEPADILDLAEELFELSSGTAQADPEAEALRGRFHALFRENHAGFKAGGRIGLRFLRKHAHLLEDRT